MSFVKIALWLKASASMLVRKNCGCFERVWFRKNHSDYSLFIYAAAGVRLHVLVYVDDLIITGSSAAIITEFKQYLSTKFHMKDLGVLRYFLGIEIARSPA